MVNKNTTKKPRLVKIGVSVCILDYTGLFSLPQFSHPKMVFLKTRCAAVMITRIDPEDYQTLEAESNFVTISQAIEGRLHRRG